MGDGIKIINRMHIKTILAKKSICYVFKKTHSLFEKKTNDNKKVNKLIYVEGLLYIQRLLYNCNTFHRCRNITLSNPSCS